MVKGITYSTNDATKKTGREIREYSKIGSDDGENTTDTILNIITNKQQTSNTSNNSSIIIKERE